MKNPPKARVGKESTTGLSIVVEGSDAEYVKKVLIELENKFKDQKKVVKTDKDFESSDENILNETLNLLDTVKAPLTPKTRGLLSIVATQNRLSLLAYAKKSGAYCITTKSWLGEVVDHLKKGRGELAGQIAFDCQHIRPDVWVVLSSDQKDLYARTAIQCGVTVMSTSVKPSETASQIMTLTQYPLHTAKPEQKSPEKESTENPTKEINNQSKIISDAGLVYNRSVSIEKIIKSTPLNEYKFAVPELNSKVLKGYTLLQNKLADNYHQANKTLSEYVKKQKSGLDPVIISRAIRPVSALNSIPFNTDVEESTLLDIMVRRIESTSSTKDDGVITLVPSLVSVSPHNEFDLLPYSDFHIAASSFDNVKQTISLTPYEEKSKRFSETIIGSEPRRDLLDRAVYTFDLVLPFYLIQELQGLLPNSRQILQTLSPRLGYDIPEFVEKANVADIFQQSFDLSLELHSLLQSAGQESESIYACLGGHRVRAIVDISALDIASMPIKASKELRDLKRELVSIISTVHPLVTLQLQPKSKPRDKQ